MIYSVPEVPTPVLAASTSLHFSTTIDQDAPLTNTSQTTSEQQSSVISQGVEYDFYDIEVVHIDNNPYFGILIPEPSSEETTLQGVIPLNLHHLNESFDTFTKLKKKHTLENVIGDPSRSNRRDLYRDNLLVSVEVLMYDIKRIKSENKGIASTKMELVLEQTQQDGNSARANINQALGLHKMEMQIPRSSRVKFIATCLYSRLNDFITSRKNDPKLLQTLISTSSSVCQSDEVMNCTINQLAKQGLVRGLPKLKFEKYHLCSACSLEKSKKHSHNPKSKDTNQEKLYLLLMDLYKPMCVESINGKKYILVIVDDYSRFTWVKFLRSKDEASGLIIKFLKMIQVRLNATVRNIRTDNEVVPKVDDVSLVDRVFDDAFGGEGEEDVVIEEGVVVTSSSLEMLTNSCLGEIMVSLIFLEGLEEEA
nr:ribonuclease H-like domain-containing protein [Tanacetum cinerariifolium]